LVLLGALVLLPATLASASSRTNIAAAKAAVLAAEAVPTYQGPTSSPKPQPGKKIFVIPCGSANTGCIEIADSIVQSDNAVGWKTTIMSNTTGTPSTISADMTTAIDDGASGIDLDAITSNTVLAGMEAAKAAHIPVVDTDGDSTVGTATTDVYAAISGQTTQSGRELADYFIVASNGLARVAVFHVATIRGTVHRYQGFMSVMKGCSSCTIVSNQAYGIVSQADFESLIKATVAAHPNIDYIFLDISQYATMAAEALQEMGLEHSIHVAGIDCLPPEVLSIKDNTGEVACAEDALTQSGWPTTNEFIRAFAGLKPLNEAFPLRLLTRSIVATGTPPYLGGFTLKPYYEKLWGLAS
jgi:ribose transport system substrate-binding protein